MFSPMIPGLPTTGPEGEQARSTGLANLTTVAKYLGQTTKGVGVLASRDGEHFHLDWCLIEYPWEEDPELDAHLEKGNLFGAVREKKVDGYYFFNE